MRPPWPRRTKLLRSASHRRSRVAASGSGLRAVGHELDGERQPVEAGEEVGQGGVGAVAVAGDGEEQRARGVLGQRLQDDRPPIGEAGQLEAAQRGDEADGRQLGEPGEGLLGAPRSASQGVSALSSTISVGDPARRLPRPPCGCAPGSRPSSRATARVDAGLVAHVLQAHEQPPVPKRRHEPGRAGRRSVSLVLPMPPGPRTAIGSGASSRIQATELVEIGLTAEEAATRGECRAWRSQAASGGSSIACGSGGRCGRAPVLVRRRRRPRA